MRHPDDIEVTARDVTLAEAAALAGVAVETIRAWRRRGHLATAGRDHRGRPLFTVIDVARAEKATRATLTSRRLVRAG